MAEEPLDDEVVLANYQETKIRHFHHILENYLRPFHET